MEIERDGKMFTLSEEELRLAYNEYRVIIIRYDLESYLDTELEDKDASDVEAFFEHIEMDKQSLLDDIVNEYMIHCENFDEFGLDEPSEKEFVIDRLCDYGFYD